MNIRHERIQHAVGHGGFHTATVQVGRATFRYVYDCGANKTQLLRDTINDHADSIADADRRIDLVVLSHLDDDHVNGVDDLLGACRVDTVVLPYLTAVERVFVAARSSRRGRLSATGQDFLIAPGSWLRDHGVARVVFVRVGPEGDGGATGAPDRPPDERRTLDDVRRVGIDWAAVAPPDIAADPTVLQSGDRFMDHTRSMPLVADGARALNWVLRSHVHECDARRRAALERAARRALGFAATADLETALTPDVLRDALRDPKTRDRLVASYSRIWSDRNLTSLCLYSGPERTPTDGEIRFLVRSHLWGPRAGIGWLGTGDAALAQAGRRNSLVHHLGTCAQNVGTLCLPHHGSRKNFDPALLAEFGNAVVCVASVPRQSHHHPARSVIRAVREAGRTFIRVSDRAAETFIERLELR